MLKNKVTENFLTDEALVGVSLEDRISVPTRRELTDSGQMHVPCAFARTGTQKYSAGQLGLKDRDPATVVTVYRDEKDVFDEASMLTFKSAPLTIGHPKDSEGNPIRVTAENSKEFQVGMLEGLPIRDEDTLSGTLVVTSKEAIDKIEGGQQELSAGYVCDIEEVDGKLYQRNIRANHIAIVDKGRAGSSCRISDEDTNVSVELSDAITAKEEAEAELSVQKQLVVDLKTISDEQEVTLERLKVELADAKLAATEGVVERCNAIENARLIADMRDLGDKSVAEIKTLVVTDQMPSLDIEGKSAEYISAMFDILVDSSKSETPMGKLLKKANVEDTASAKYVCPVEEARKRSIKRNKTLGK